MIAPTTLAVAEILNAEKRYGSAEGTRSFQRIDQPLAAYECMSSIARGSADCRPRSVLTVTGKNVRYAAMTATRIQSAGVQPLIVRLPRPTTTIGAIARIGIVCDATMYGSRPRCSMRNCESTTPRTNPIDAPIAKPTAASFAVKSAECQSRVIRSGPPVCAGWKSWPTILWTCGMVMSLTANGCVQPVRIQSHR